MDLSEKHYSLMDSRSYRGFPGFLTSVKVRGFTGRAASGRYSRRTCKLLLYFSVMEQWNSWSLYCTLITHTQTEVCAVYRCPWRGWRRQVAPETGVWISLPPHPTPTPRSLQWSGHTIQSTSVNITQKIAEIWSSCRRKKFICRGLNFK